MRTITIVGAGQAGLQLGIGLLQQGYTVNLVSNRTGEQIAAGRVLSSQSMYDMALGFERELGLALWDDICPPTMGVHMRAGNGEGLGVDWRARMTGAWSVGRPAHQDATLDDGVSAPWRQPDHRRSRSG